MIQSLRRGAPLLVLALVGLAWGQSASPTSPGGRAYTLTVQEVGKGPQVCKILKAWTESSGHRAYQVQATDTGELMTVLEVLSGPATNGPRTVSTRVFRYGKATTPPPGVPGPPPHATVYAAAGPANSPYAVSGTAMPSAVPTQVGTPPVTVQALKPTPTPAAPSVLPTPPVVSRTVPAEKAAPAVVPVAERTVVAKPTPEPAGDWRQSWGKIDKAEAAPAPYQTTPQATTPVAKKEATDPLAQPAAYSKNPIVLEPAQLAVNAPAAPAKMPVIVQSPPVAPVMPAAPVATAAPAPKQEGALSWLFGGKTQATPTKGVIKETVPPPAGGGPITAAGKCPPCPVCPTPTPTPTATATAGKTPPCPVCPPTVTTAAPPVATTPTAGPLVATPTPCVPCQEAPSATASRLTPTPAPVAGPAPKAVPVVEAPKPVEKTVAAPPKPIVTPGVPVGMESVRAVNSREFREPLPVLHVGPDGRPLTGNVPTTPTPVAMALPPNRTANAFTDPMGAQPISPDRVRKDLMPPELVAMLEKGHRPGVGPNGQPVLLPNLAPPTAGPLAGTPLPPIAPRATAAPGNVTPVAGSAAVEQLRHILKDGLLPSEREQAVDQLALYEARKTPAAVDALLAGAMTDPAPTVRVACIRALGKMRAGTADVLGALGHLAQDADPKVKAAATEVLPLLQSR